MSFTLNNVGLSATEGATYSFDVTPDSVLSADEKVRWEIIFRGDIPVFSSDFISMSGDLDFVSGATASQTITLSIADDNSYGIDREFVIRVWDTHNTADDISDDTQIGEDAVVILQDDDTNNFTNSVNSFTGLGDNIFTAASSIFLNFVSASGDDSFIITRFQYGNVRINDTAGSSYIKFDRGVTIEAINEEVVSFGGREVTSVDLILSTGSTITIEAPTKLEFQYQLGDSRVLDYGDFISTLGTVSASLPYVVTGSSTVATPDDGFRNEIGLYRTVGDDIMGLGSDFDLNITGGLGDDSFIITRFQYGDVSINDVAGSSYIKFDRGVTIVSVYETVFDFGMQEVTSVDLILSTGSTISIDAPTKPEFQYQFGDGVLLNYEDFVSALSSVVVSVAGDVSSDRYVVGGVIFDAGSYHYSVSENLDASGVGNAMVLGSISATVTSGETLNYAFDGGTLTDSLGHFAITSVGEISYIGSGLDREITSVHYLKVQATSSDGSVDVANISIEVDNVNDAPTINLTDPDSTFSITEGTALTADSDTGSVFTFSDPEGEPYTYTVDDSRFYLRVSDNHLIAKDGAVFDYEAGSDVVVVITATNDADSNEVYTRSTTISITNVNETPTINLTDPASTFSITEGTLTADSDTGSVFTFSDPEGEPYTYTVDDSRFYLRVSDNHLIAKDGAVFDYEAGSDVVVVITATNDADSNEVYTRSTTISITNVNETPTINLTDPASTFSITEGTLTADSDTGSVFTFSDPEGEPYTYTVDDSRFYLRVSDNHLIAQSGAVFDYEAGSDVVVVITATNDADASEVYTRSTTIFIANVYEAPTINLTDPASTFSITEGTALTADSDTGSVFTFSDPEGEPYTYTVNDSRFYLRVSDNHLIAKDGAVFDYEAGSDVVVVITATNDADSNEVYTRSTTISITNVNETPTINLTDPASTFSITEGTLSADRDTGSVFTFSDPEGEPYTYTVNDSRFYLRVSDNHLIAKDGAVFDYEAGSDVVVVITATNDADSNEVYTRSTTISITNVNETPTINLTDPASTFSITEGTLTADSDTGSVFTFSDPEGEPYTYTVDDSRFYLRVSDNHLIAKDGAVFDYEAGSDVVVVITATNDADASEVYTRSTTISITNVNETPTINLTDPASTFSITEGTLTADSDTGSVFTFSDPEGEPYTYTVDDSRFYLRVSDNHLIAKDGAVFDYETEPRVNVVITATNDVDASEVYTRSTTIFIANVYENPTINLTDPASTFSITEGTLSADRDTGSVFTFSDPEGEPYTYTVDDSRFYLRVSDNHLIAKDGAVFDYEAGSDVVVVITATNDADASEVYTRSTTISITNVNETPTINLTDPASTFSITEGTLTADSDTGSVFTFSDPENEPYTYTVDDSRFALVSNNHLIAQSGAVFDYEAGSDVVVVITATNDVDASEVYTRSTTISITNVYEAPTINLTDPASTFSITEGTLSADSDTGSVFTFSDPENEPYTYTVDDSRFALDSNNHLIAQSGAVFDYEPLTNGQLSVTITATNTVDTSEVYTQSTTISIINVYEAPVFSTATDMLSDPISSVTNLALNTVTTTTVDTNITQWSFGTAEENIANINDGDLTAVQYGASVFPYDANGKYIRFDLGDYYVQGKFIYHNKTSGSGAVLDIFNVNGSTVDFIKDGVSVYSEVIANADNIVTITAPVDIIFDTARITFSGNDQNFREIEVFGSRARLNLFNFDENIATTVSVYTASATADALATSSVVYTLGGTDGSDFNISSSGVVTFKVSPNYEDKNYYVFDVIATTTDSNNVSLSATRSVELFIQDVYEAPTINLTDPASTFSITEGTLTADSDTGSVFTFSDPEGEPYTYTVDDSRFYLRVSDNHLIAQSGAVFDYEAGSDVVVVITATNDADASEVYTRSTTISITNVNETPTINLTDPDSTFSITEGTALTADSDTGSVFTFSDPEGEPYTFTVDDSRFELRVSDNHLIAQSGAVFDYETEPRINVVITATNDADLNEVYTQSTTIFITNVYEAPVFSTATDMLSDPISSVTNLALNTVTTTTVDTNITQWSFGTAEENIANINDGDLTAVQYGASVFPYDANGKYIRFDLGDYYVQGKFIYHNKTSGSGAVLDIFNVNGSTVDFIKDGVSVYSEVIANADNIVTITAPVDIIFDTARITFSGNDQNFREIEVFGSRARLNLFNFDENIATTVSVYTALATADALATSAVVYTLGGTDASSFNIGGSSGFVTFIASPDYESGKTEFAFDVIATTTDSNNVSLSATRSVELFIQDVNYPPVVDERWDEWLVRRDTETPFTYTIPKNAFRDPEGNTLTYSYSFDDRNQPISGGGITFDASTNTFTLSTNPSVTGYYDMNVTVIYSQSASVDFVLPLHIIDAPTLQLTSDLNTTIVKGMKTAGDIIYIPTYDADTYSNVSSGVFEAAKSLTYTLDTTYGDGSLFEINSISGVVTLKNDIDFNDELKSHYAIEITATLVRYSWWYGLTWFDTDYVSTWRIGLDVVETVEGINHPPVIDEGWDEWLIRKGTTATSFTYTIPENAFTDIDGDALVYLFDATDDQPFSGASVSFNTVSLNTFSIENSPSVTGYYDINVRAIDSGGAFTDFVIPLHIIDYAALQLTSDLSIAIAEGMKTAGDTIYTPTHDDNTSGIGAAKSLTYSLDTAYGDGSLFNIDSSTGVVTLKNNINFDYEIKSHYAIEITATLVRNTWVGLGYVNKTYASSWRIRIDVEEPEVLREDITNRGSEHYGQAIDGDIGSSFGGGLTQYIYFGNYGIDYFKNGLFTLYNTTDETRKYDIVGTQIFFKLHMQQVYSETINSSDSVIKIKPPKNVVFDEVIIQYQNDTQYHYGYEIFGREIVDITPEGYGQAVTGSVADLGHYITFDNDGIDSYKNGVFVLYNSRGDSTRYEIVGSDVLFKNNLGIVYSYTITRSDVNDAILGILSIAPPADTKFDEVTLYYSGTTQHHYGYDIFGDRVDTIIEITPAGYGQAVTGVLDGLVQDITFDNDGIDSYKNGAFTLYNSTDDATKNDIKGSRIVFKKNFSTVYTQVIDSHDDIVTIIVPSNIEFNEVVIEYSGLTQNHRGFVISGTKIEDVATTIPETYFSENITLSGYGQAVTGVLGGLVQYIYFGNHATDNYKNGSFVLYNSTEEATKNYIVDSRIIFKKNLEEIYVYTISSSDVDNAPNGVLLVRPPSDIKFDEIVIVYSGLTQNHRGYDIFGTKIETISVREDIEAGSVIYTYDAHADGHSYTLEGSDVSDFTVSDRGIISFDNSPAYETQNSHDISLIIEDTLGYRSEVEINVDVEFVEGINHAPVIDGGWDEWLIRKDTATYFTYTIPDDAFRDPDGDALTYLFDYLDQPIDSADNYVASNLYGENSFTISNPTVTGYYGLNVTVEDSQGASVDFEIPIHII